MKKIAIITFNQETNWGAMLQAYALQAYLISKGNYVNHIKIKNKKHNVKYIKKLIALKLNNLSHFVRNARFAKFSKNHLSFSNYIVTSGAKNPNISEFFDVFVCGSDQVWNCKHDIDKPYYLSFVVGKPKISYAASFGLEEIPNAYASEVRELLCDYQAISVREETGAAILRNIGVRCDCVALDPVFLLNQTKWESLIPPNTRSSSEAYIFVYMPKLNDHTRGIVQYMKETTKLEVKTTYAIPGCTYCGNIGPIEFLDLISHAKYVFTSSFHATAFSIIFRKTFFVSTDNEKGNRVKHLLNLIGLEHQIIKKDELPALDCSIDYSSANTILDEQIKHSERYLLNNIDGGGNDIG